MKNDILNTLLNGVSKSLYIVNEVIPIYKDTAPLVKKVKGVFKNNNKVNNVVIKKELEVKDKEYDNKPKFYL